MMKTVFILAFAITSGGGTIEGEVEQTFATKQECMAELIESHRKSFKLGSDQGIIALANR